MPPSSSRLFTIPATARGTRLDRFLAELSPDLSRSRIQALIEEGHVKIEGMASVAPSLKLKEGMRGILTVPEAVEATPLAQSIPLEILYEDDDLLVINKQAGIVVHPGAGNPDRTLVNALLAHCGASLSGIGGVKRPGIVHRLDKGTSGLLVVAKNDAAHHGLSLQFSNRSLKRTYRALVWGSPKTSEGTIEGNIGRHPRQRQKMALLKTGGKPAVTHYKVLERFGTLASLVECELETGRTHQIRVHLSHLGHGLIGDATYGKEPRGLSSLLRQEILRLTRDKTRPMLHAMAVRFRHPRTGECHSYTTSLPRDFEDMYLLLQTGQRASASCLAPQRPVSSGIAGD